MSRPIDIKSDPSMNNLCQSSMRTVSGKRNKETTGQNGFSCK